MKSKIKKNYLVWIDAYWKKHRKHYAAGICEHCGKAEGTIAGNKIRCPECFDKIVKGVIK